MRKLTALAVALGFLATTSLPTFAAPAVSGVTTTLSAQAQQDDANKPKPTKKKTTKKSTKKKTTKKSTKKKSTKKSTKKKSAKKPAAPKTDAAPQPK